jgi:hypothetical protein
MATTNYCDLLIQNGYAILPAVDPKCLMRAYDDMRALDCDGHPAKSQPLDAMNRFVSRESINAVAGTPQQRESWFLSDKWTGPYGAAPHLFHSCVLATLDRHFPGLLNTGHSYRERPWAMGVHVYRPVGLPAAGAEGLYEHYDVDTVSALYSDQPLEALVDGKWTSIHIPRGHLMVFSGLVGFIAHGGNPLLHRVPYCTVPKFSVGVFIGPDFDQPLVAGKVSVGEFYKTYFAERDAAKMLAWAKTLRGD